MTWLRVQLGYAIPNGYTGPVGWLDGDYDERTGQVLNVCLPRVWILKG